jgi:hypothetical protein
MSQLIVKQILIANSWANWPNYFIFKINLKIIKISTIDNYLIIKKAIRLANLVKFSTFNNH